MRPERLRELDEILDEALDLPPDEREALLERRMPDDPEMRAEARSLLAAESNAAFLDLPAVDPTRIGAYRILRRLGSGGAGLVYEAIRDGASAPCALKVQRASRAGNGMRRSMFEREVAALSRLRHPAIARIHEAGVTPDGWQFLALELIRGRSITEHARAERLDLAARLELFRTVCDAVHCAHEHGILHRDLKPANVMVGSDGRPRVLDFGLARLIGERGDTSFTDLGVIVGTLPYLSPEQAAGGNGDVDRRVDVYALGVMLYELVTWRMPFDFAGVPPHEVLRTIREDDPPPPRAIDRTVPPALDRVVRRALAKDRGDRYATADLLADDVRRVLAGERVHARPPSAVARLRGLARRHPRAASAAAVALVAVSLSGAGLWMKNRELRAETRRARGAETAASESAASARHEAEKGAEILDFIQRMLDSTRPDVERGRRVTLREFLDETAGGLEREFEGQPEVRSGLHAAIGSAYLALGLAREAEPHLRAHLGHERASGADARSARGHADMRLKLATALERQGRYSAALEELESTNALLDDLTDADELRVSALLAEGRVLLDLGRDAEAQERLAEARAVAHGLSRADERSAVEALYLEAELRRAQGDAAAAEELFRDALERQLALAGEEHSRTAEIRVALGQLLGKRGELEAAEEHTRRALETRILLYEEDRDVVVSTRHNLAVLLLQQGRLEEAEQLLVQVLEVWRRAPGPPHEDVAATISTLGAVCDYLGRLDEAERYMREALDSYRASEGKSDATLSNHLTNLARVLVDRGTLDEAERLTREGLELRRRSLPPGDERLGDSLLLLGDIRQQAGDAVEAAALFREALPRLEAAYGAGDDVVGACRAALDEAERSR